MANKRIIDLAEITDVASETYVMVDSEVDGTRRYDLSQMGDEISSIDSRVGTIDNRVTTLEQGTTIANNAVTTAKIADGAVTLPKLAGDIFTVISTQAIAEMFED